MKRTPRRPDRPLGRLRSRLRLRGCPALALPGAVLLLLAAGHEAAAAQRLYLPAVQTVPRVATVTTSAPHGLYAQPFRLALQTVTPGATIYFTTDGSAPSASNGQPYAGPIEIARSTVVRATAHRPGFRDAPVTTRTYVLVEDVVSQSDTTAKERGFPTTWGKYTDDWVLDGRYVPARYGMRREVVAEHEDEVRAALQALPALSIAAAPEDVFGPGGIYANPMVEGDERPASFEILAAGGDPGLQIDCGLRIAGGYSRRPDVAAKHSFSVRFRSRYGSGRLRAALFPGSPVASFDVLRLRAGQADAFYFFADKAQYLHDQWARDTQRAMGSLSARGRYAHLFVNGLYWGVYNLTEEPTSAFASDHLGGDEEDWDVIKDGDAVDGRWLPEVEDGSMDAYAEMVGIVDRHPDPTPDRPEDRVAYDRLSAVLDLEQHADYTLLQIFGANYDWPEKNWRAARQRAGSDRFRFFVWDYEHTTALRDDPSRGFCLPRLDPVTGACGFNADTAGVAGLHGWLRRFPDYRVLFSDRVQRHMLDEGGALRPEAMALRYEALAAELGPAIVAEAARWGTASPEPMTDVVQGPVWRDYRRRHGGQPQTPAMWLAERDRLLGAYFPTRGDQVLAQLCREGLFPPVRTPVVTAAGIGSEAAGLVAIQPGNVGCPGSSAAGTIYYTRDGSDPRAPGGAVGPTARAYVGPFKVGGFARIRTRLLGPSPDGPQWSALAETDIGAPRLGVSEIMYHPDGDADAEFLELRNLEASAADFSGYGVGAAVTFTLRSGTLLPPGGHLVLVRDEAAFDARYPGVPVAGEYDGKLDNAGETLVLRDRAGRETATVTYDDEGLWPLAPDGLGYSLVPVDESSAARAHPDAWRASAQVGGSPGRADPVPAYGRGWAVVNEVLARPGPTQDYAVELHNPTDTAVDVGGWFLGDDPDDPRRYRFPLGSVLGPGAYATVYGPDLLAAGLRLAPAGGSVYLASSTQDGRLTGLLSGTAYEPAEEGRSSGRVVTKAGASLSVLERPTFGVDQPTDPADFRRGRGMRNSPAYVGPVVLNEVMYHPPGDGPEYVELLNRSERDVALYAPEPPYRSWSLEGGIRFAFPAGIVLPAGGYAVVAATDPEAFRARMAIPGEVPVLGPFEGRLDNAGERLFLRAPLSDVEPSTATWVVVDRVQYADRSPWPAAADGSGPALERVEPGAYGGDPANWTALSRGGTPGRPNTVPRAAYLPVAVAGR